MYTPKATDSSVSSAPSYYYYLNFLASDLCYYYLLVGLGYLLVLLPSPSSRSRERFIIQKKDLQTPKHKYTNGIHSLGSLGFGLFGD